MKGSNFYTEIIKNRKKAALAHIRTGRNLPELEREMALLVLDILDALEAKSFTVTEGCKCFMEIEAVLDVKTRRRLSEEFRDLLNEAVVLDDMGTPYGPDLVRMRSLIAKILKRDEERSRHEPKHPTSIFASKQKRTKVPLAAA